MPRAAVHVREYVHTGYENPNVAKVIAYSKNGRVGWQIRQMYRPDTRRKKVLRALSTEPKFADESLPAGGFWPKTPAGRGEAEAACTAFRISVEMVLQRGGVGRGAGGGLTPRTPREYTPSTRDGTRTGGRDEVTAKAAFDASTRERERLAKKNEERARVLGHRTVDVDPRDEHDFAMCTESYVLKRARTASIRRYRDRRSRNLRIAVAVKNYMLRRTRLLTHV